MWSQGCPTPILIRLLSCFFSGLVPATNDRVQRMAARGVQAVLMCTGEDLADDGNPIADSLLTQLCSVAVELHDPDVSPRALF